MTEAELQAILKFVDDFRYTDHDTQWKRCQCETCKDLHYFRDACGRLLGEIDRLKKA